MPNEPLPTEPPAFLPGPRKVVEGYYNLETHERNQQNYALSLHEDAVTLWHRALTLYRQAALVPLSISTGETGEPDPAELLQARLLELGVSSMKAALDMLLAGYYSVAFGVIRHMLESFVQFVYVIYRPGEARRLVWEQGGGTKDRSPKMTAMCQAIQSAQEVKGARLHALIDEIYDACDLMSKGSHPTGLGTLQTLGPSPREHLIGATYRPELCLLGFDAGLVAVSHLLPMALIWAKPETGAWAQDWYALDEGVDAWRAAHALEVQAARGQCIYRIARGSNRQR